MFRKIFRSGHRKKIGTENLHDIVHNRDKLDIILGPYSQHFIFFVTHEWA
jgi:hypothetical protein